MGPSGPTNPHDRHRPPQPLAAWAGFWLFAAAALGILAGTALAPLWTAHSRILADYRTLAHQNDQLTQRLQAVTCQIDALTDDPQYTERITMKELNLRKPGEEMIAVDPVPVQPRQTIATPNDHTGRQPMAVFLHPKNRPWLFGLSAGLFLAAMLTTARPPQLAP